MSNEKAHIVEIPVEYKSHFIKDPTVAWQSFGSFGHHSSSPYFENMFAIRTAVKERSNPFSNETFVFDSNFQCEDNYLRFMHIDLAISQDSCGIAMCHIPDWKPVMVSSNDKTGRVVYDRQMQPYIKFDCIIRIEPPEEGEIDIAQIREIIFELSEQRNFPIQLITYDRFASADSIQILRNRGYIVAYLSMDSTKTYPVVNVAKDNNIERVSTGGGKIASIAAWSMFKSAVNTERIDLPTYKIISLKEAARIGIVNEATYEQYTEITWIEKEMMQAIFDSEKCRIKEPPYGSIDLLEACVGAAFNAVNNVDYEASEKEGISGKVDAIKGNTSVFDTSLKRKVHNRADEEDSEFVDDSIFD